MRSEPAANITLLALMMAMASVPSLRPRSLMASMVMSALTMVDPRSMETTPFTAPSAMAETVPLSWLRADIFIAGSFRWGLPASPEPVRHGHSVAGSDAVWKKSVGNDPGSCRFVQARAFSCTKPCESVEGS